MVPLLLLVLLKLLMAAMSLGWGSGATLTSLVSVEGPCEAKGLGKDAPKKELGERELCGGVCGGGTVWSSKNGSVFRLSGAGLDCLRCGVQCQARRVRRDDKFEQQLWCGSCRQCRRRGLCQCE